MKIFTAKKKFDLKLTLLTIAFFITTTFLFSLYNIDFSPLILVIILAIYLKYFYRQKNLPSYLDLLLLVSFAILIVLLTTVIFNKLFPLSIPAIGFIILVTILFDNLQLSFLFSIFLSTLAASVLKGNMGLLVGASLLSASLMAALLSYRVRTRSKIIKAVLYAGIVQFCVAFIVKRSQALYSLPFSDIDLIKGCSFSIVFSSIVIAFLPVFEYVFRVVTNISLLELSDFNHPLLKRMILEAPGTYQHSLVVANLAESASEAIGANPLLARVGAYYHDIGKIPKAHYFVENQIPYRDVHKDLKPSISKLIIINHVKEGIELAKKYRLNPKIVDFIAQHHGKSLVYYFYQRAKEMEPLSEHEEEYRYPGPRPQSKEIATVSLADTIEALSRTLEEPTPSRIEEMVKDLVRKKFIEGELDESDLTLKDLEKIAESFVRILNAIFHTRINYPQNGANKKSSKSQENKSK